MPDLETQRIIDNLMKMVQDIEDSLRNHKHSGLDLTQILSGVKIDQSVLLNGMTLGDGRDHSGTLTMKLAKNKGDVFIKAGTIADGDFANTGGGSGFIMGIDDSDSDKVKFYFGDATNFIKWDATTLTIAGNLTVEWPDILDGGGTKPDDNATQGSTIGTDLLDTDGNTPGQDTVVNFKVLTAGEDLVAGNVACIKPLVVDVLPSDDVYVWEFQPTTNFNTGGNNVRLRVGLAVASRQNITFIKFDMDNVPETRSILRAELVLTTRQAISGPIDTKNLRRVSGADWVEGTITWDTKPSVTNDIPEIYANPREFEPASVGNEVAINITNLVKHWKNGIVDNFGLSIEHTTSNELDFNSKETDNVPSTRPFLRITRLDSSDEKMYKTSSGSYELSRSVIGVIQETIATDAQGKVQVQGGIPAITGIGAITSSRIYLKNAAGNGTEDPGLEKRLVPFAKNIGSSNFFLNIQDKDIFIEDILEDVSTIDITSAPSKRFYINNDVRYVIVRWRSSTDTEQPQSIVKVMRDVGIMADVDNLTNSNTSAELSIAFSVDFITLSKSGAGTIRVLNILLYT